MRLLPSRLPKNGLAFRCLQEFQKFPGRLSVLVKICGHGRSSSIDRFVFWYFHQIACVFEGIVPYFEGDPCIQRWSGFPFLNSFRTGLHGDGDLLPKMRNEAFLPGDVLP